MFTIRFFVRLYQVPFNTVGLLYLLILVTITAVVVIKVATFKFKGSKKVVIKFNNKYWLKFTKKLSNFTRWLVRLLLEKSEGVSEETEESLESSHKRELYIGKTKMEDLDVIILGVVIICFGLLLLTAAYSSFLLKVTRTCTDDSAATYCFLQFINKDAPNNPAISEQNLTYPITDCSLWDNPDFAPFITFECFAFSYNVQAGLATAGGLLALFTLSLRTAVTLILKAFVVTKKCCKPKFQLALQITAVIFLLAMNVIVMYILITTQLNITFGTAARSPIPVPSAAAGTLSEALLNVLIVLGTVTLLLLLPWTKYASSGLPNASSGLPNTNQATSSLKNGVRDTSV